MRQWERMSKGRQSQLLEGPADLDLKNWILYPQKRKKGPLKEAGR